MSDRSKPETEYLGRLHTARIEFLVPVEVSVDQIEEWIAYQLGGGICHSGNPLLTDCVNRVEVIDTRPEMQWRFIVWQPEDAAGGRKGRQRIEREPPASTRTNG